MALRLKDLLQPIVKSSSQFLMLRICKKAKNYARGFDVFFILDIEGPLYRKESRP
jgi:hypothetical protein